MVKINLEKYKDKQYLNRLKGVQVANAYIFKSFNTDCYGKQKNDEVKKIPSKD